MVILAIDPGVEKVGYAIFEKKASGTTNFKYVSSGLVKTLKTELHELRLQQIYNALKTIVYTYKPELIVLEQLFFFKNQKTAIKVAQSQGTIMLLAAQEKILVKLLTPLQIKQIITGYGMADKKSVQKMISMLLKEELVFKEDDQSDAIACGLAYCFINDNLVG